MKHHDAWPVITDGTKFAHFEISLASQLLVHVSTAHWQWHGGGSARPCHHVGWFTNFELEVQSLAHWHIDSHRDCTLWHDAT